MPLEYLSIPFGKTYIQSLNSSPKTSEAIFIFFLKALTEQLCIKIGSSVNSQHARAEAADFEVMGTDYSDRDWETNIASEVLGEELRDWI